MPNDVITGKRERNVLKKTKEYWQSNILGHTSIGCVILANVEFKKSLQSVHKNVVCFYLNVYNSE